MGCGDFAALTEGALARAGVGEGFAGRKFAESSFKGYHPVLEFDAPEIQVRGNQLHSQIPAVGPLCSLPDNHSLRRLPRGKIRQPELLLHLDFPGINEQAAIAIYDAGKARLEVKRPGEPPIPFDGHRDARVHAWPASPLSHANFSWQAFPERHILGPLL